MKFDFPLLWAIIWKSYKYHMGMCLLILFGYLWSEFIPSENYETLWYTHGWTSLLIPILVLVPIILMINDSYEHYKEIQKYYPNGYINRKNKSK